MERRKQKEHCFDLCKVIINCYSTSMWWYHFGEHMKVPSVSGWILNDSSFELYKFILSGKGNLWEPGEIAVTASCWTLPDSWQRLFSGKPYYCTLICCPGTFSSLSPNLISFSSQSSSPQQGWEAQRQEIGQQMGTNCYLPGPLPSLRNKEGTTQMAKDFYNLKRNQIIQMDERTHGWKMGQRMCQAF